MATLIKPAEITREIIEFPNTKDNCNCCHDSFFSMVPFFRFSHSIWNDKKCKRGRTHQSLRFYGRDNISHCIIKFEPHELTYDKELLGTIEWPKKTSLPFTIDGKEYKYGGIFPLSLVDKDTYECSVDYITPL